VTRPMILVLTLCTAWLPAAGSEVGERVAGSREAVRGFAERLESALQAAMAEGGPANAIAVCNERAPAIAGAAGEAIGGYVGRTSLRLRNPANAPNAWERAVLERFEARRAGGEDPGALEHYAVITRGDRRVFRYMKAIPTRGLCLACHGEQLSPEVAAKLDRLYPEDRARGFEVGDIRGAFTVRWPMQ